MRAAHLIWAVLAVLAVNMFGCASKMDAASAPGSYAEEAYYAEAEAADEYYGSDGGGYDFEDDMVDGEVLSPEGANLASRGRSKQASMIGVRGTFEADAPPAGPTSPDPSPDSGSDPGSEGKKEGGEVTSGPRPTNTAHTREAKDPPKPEPASRRRQVVYTATMQISVFEVEASVDFAEDLPSRLGGWVQSRSDTTIVLRIPAARLDEAMELLGERGVVDQRTLQALDVTDKYTDLESRIRVLAETQAQLRKLLEQAKTVEQALEIRKALDGVTMELELARARMRELAGSIAFSTLTVRFKARGPLTDVPSSNDPFPWVLNLGVEATEYR